MTDASCERVFQVAHTLGLHARPAGRFVSLASRFQSNVEVAREGDVDGDWVSGRSVLSLLSLAASFGTRLRVRATGPDAELALVQLGQVLEEPSAADGG